MVTMVFIVTKHAKIASIITLVLCISVKSYSIYVGASLNSVKIHEFFFIILFMYLFDGSVITF